jgi:hypothetical protein
MNETWEAWGIDSETKKPLILNNGKYIYEEQENGTLTYQGELIEEV